MSAVRRSGRTPTRPARFDPGEGGAASQWGHVPAVGEDGHEDDAVGRDHLPVPAASAKTLLGATLASAGIRNRADGHRTACDRPAASGDVISLPYGPSLYPVVSASDPSPLYLQRLYVLVTTFVLLLLLPSTPALLVSAGADGGYDQAHGVNTATLWTSPAGVVNAFTILLEQTMGLSSESSCLCLAATGALFALLVAADLAGGLLGVSEMWPESWGCANTRCYIQMFSEP